MERNKKGQFIKRHQLNKGRIFTHEHRHNLSLAQRKRFKEHPETNGMLGIHHSEEMKRNLSIKFKGKHHSPSTELKKGHIFNKGVAKTLEHIKKLRQLALKPERIKISTQNLPKNVQGQKNPFYGKHHTKYSKVLMSNKARERFNNPEFKEKFLKINLQARLKRPTSLEKAFIELCKEHKLPYGYVGDGKIIINGANPDFINNNGQKFIIETASRYHHRPSYPRERQAIFGKYGFKVLVLWSDYFWTTHNSKTLKENWKENILSKIKEFELEKDDKP